MRDGDNDRLRDYYDENAGIYDRWMDSYDRFMLGDARARLCALATGRTLELAIGTGLNLPLYAADVDLVGLDYSPKMLEVASARAGRLGRPVELVVGDAHDLEFADAEFDTVLTTLFLSSVPDPHAAAAEAFRVLKPGGQLLVLDHVRSDVAPVRWLEQLTAPFVQPRTGVDLRRDPLDYLPGIGFRIDHRQRAKLGVIEAVVATRP